MADLNPLTREELERIKEHLSTLHGCVGVDYAKRLIADLERARGLLRRVQDSEWNEYQRELRTYLREAGELE